MTVLLTTAYLPNLHYFFYVLHSDTIFIEQFEHYQKQSFRNRTQILSANGILDLVIPVEKKATKELTKDISISYTEKWQTKHWRAITSAYKNSPYFDFFEDELKYFYENEFEFLCDFNLQQLNLLLKILKQKKEIQFTSTYEKTPNNILDLRNIIHPKIDFRNDERVSNILQKNYYQTFENKFSFIPNLSVLDLVFNTGLEAVSYLVSNSKS
ncbi:MAG: WbqC family protein [Bacteroidetes bacterium]|nr:WbqC family protein [Bacteroidota bacterium]